jgi:hypothetical protein
MTRPSEAQSIHCMGCTWVVDRGQGVPAGCAVAVGPWVTWGWATWARVDQGVMVRTSVRTSALGDLSRSKPACWFWLAGVGDGGRRQGSTASRLTVSGRRHRGLVLVLSGGSWGLTAFRGLDTSRPLIHRLPISESKRLSSCTQNQPPAPKLTVYTCIQ